MTVDRNIVTKSDVANQRFTSDEQLQNWFAHHPPNNDAIEAHQAVRQMFLSVARVLNSMLPEGPDKTTTFRAMREAMFQANATIACGGGPARTGVTDYAWRSQLVEILEDF
jgi:hypothetical protein